ncbi:MAG: cyclase [Ignavibacteria bacterium]
MLIVIGMVALASCTKRQPHVSERTIIDLTYAFDSTTIYWPTEKGFRFEKGFEGITPGGYFYSANSFAAPEHGGTHIDAPIHFAEGKHTADAIPVEQLVARGVLIDVSKKCAANRDYQVQIEDFVEWERNHGELPKGCIVLMRTGFGTFWPDRVAYMGTDERGQDAVEKLHFPGLHPETAKWLVSSRSIKAIGLDTPSIDYGQSTQFESHVTLFVANIPAFENVAHLDRLPATGFTIVALPMKINRGSGAPLRIIAIMD